MLWGRAKFGTNQILETRNKGSIFDIDLQEIYWATSRNPSAYLATLESFMVMF